MTEVTAMRKGIVVMTFGDPGSGKSFTGGTVPHPAIVLDAEGGTEWVDAHEPMVEWNPFRLNAEGKKEFNPLPEGVGKNIKTVVVRVLDWDTIKIVEAYLRSGNHPFKSVILDSITELQKRLVDKVAGTDQPTLQQWGELGRSFDDMVRRFRDLKMLDKNPLQAIVMIALKSEVQGSYMPLIKGGGVKTLPGYADVVAYTTVRQNPDAPSEQQYVAYIAQAIAPTTTPGVSVSITAKCRPTVILKKFGTIVPDPNISEWIAAINTPVTGGK